MAKTSIQDSAWKSQLESNKDGSPRKTLQSVLLILENSQPGPVFQRNEFTNRDTYGLNTAWGGRKNAELSDDDAVRVKVWLSKNFKLEPNVNLIYEAMTFIAQKNSFHPVRDYFRKLKWDGEPRLDHWMRDYLGATGPDPYLMDVSRKTLVAIIARVMTPGIKFDCVPIFEGPQGIGKSTAAGILAGEWFCDHLPDLRSADARLNLQGKLVVELSELAGIKHAEVEIIKSFIACQSDRVRPPYGRKALDLKRQCIFIGTTNNFQYLKDKSGNRRFWPVRIGECLLDKLRQDRDQLFAEAVHIWDLGESLWLDNPESVEQAQEIQDSRIVEDEESLMADALACFLREQSEMPEHERKNLDKFKIRDLFESDGPFGSAKPGITGAYETKQWKYDGWTAQLAAGVLKRNGFSNKMIKGEKWWTYDPAE